MMTRLFALAFVLMALPAQAQTTRPAPLVEGDTVVLRGCVATASDHTVRPRSLIAWAPGDLVFDGTIARSGLPAATPPDAPAPFAYWLGDEGDLQRFTGERVRITGEVTGTQTGEMLVEEHGPATEFRFRINGGEEVALVPTAWLGPTTADPQFDASLYGVQVRQVDIEAVESLGRCDPA